jgi:hypothetical protein
MSADGILGFFTHESVGVAAGIAVSQSSVSVGEDGGLFQSQEIEEIL